MTTLVLGVIDLPYVDAEPAKSQVTRVSKARAGRRRVPKGKPALAAGGQTTGDVAEILEAKYHVMETFFDLHEEEIGEDFAESLVGTLEALTSGAPTSIDPFAAAISQVEARFKTFLETKEMDATGTPGVPTRASLKGVSHRFKRKRGPPRPSFIDTGLYESTMKAWVENS